MNASITNAGAHPPLIGLSGRIGCGKDTAADILCRRFPCYERRTIAGTLRQVVHALTGVSPQQSESRAGKALPTAYGCTVATLLQRVGVGLRATLGDNVWLTALLGADSHQPSAEYALACANGRGWIVSDVRFPNEADRVRALGGLVVRIEGDPALVRAQNLDARDLAHVSETALDTYAHFDCVIHNDGTRDLFEQRLVQALEPLLRAASQ